MMEQTTWNSLGFFDHIFPQLKASKIDVTERYIIGKRLDWDSSFFKAGIYKLNSLPENVDLDWKSRVGLHESDTRWNVFAEVPSEDIIAFRRLGKLGFSLVETRLTYYHLLDSLKEESHNCRVAHAADIPSLRVTASSAVNDYDKYHADPFFSKEETNRFLETYIENCVNGLAERVFVPDLKSSPASFVALSKKDDDRFEHGFFYRIPLTACLPLNKGWHYPLCLHALHYAKSQKAGVLIMTTQSTNKAVIHNCEKLGFKLGSCTHLFSKSST
jgi:dTDP-4-amino-4,6-dideoxy-D-galactose acyltransferase